MNLIIEVNPLGLQSQADDQAAAAVATRGEARTLLSAAGW
jgi:hypothetical protein